MAIESRIRELGSRHHAIDDAIQDELTRPSSDALRLQQLKRQKLKLKEEMESLKARLH